MVTLQRSRRTTNINTVLHEWISVAWDKFPETASYVELMSSEAQITKR